MATYIAIVLVILVCAACLWAVLDYRKWVALGKGGLPHTLRGWLEMTRLRLQKTNTIRTDVYAPLIGGPDDVSRLGDLPVREGPRPRIAVYPIPHRQLDQRPSADIRSMQDDLFDSYVEQRGRFVCYQTSNYERHNNAVFVRPEYLNARSGRETRGESGHVHPSDGSMHMIFGPSDSKTVIDKGWGERHPLSGVRPGLSLNYVMIYAPRTAAEIAVIGELLRAAISNVCTCEVDSPRLEYRPR